jgi:phosphoribosylamine--glycine ligase
MKVLIIGSGGREHALAWKCATSPRVTEVIVATGNAGTVTEPKTRNVELQDSGVPALLNLALREKPDLTIVGPEGPLVAGVVDAFTAQGLKCFGPKKVAAQLEGSKAFTKEFLSRHHIPTARSKTFTRENFDRGYVERHSLPVVVKASGLASGKGVVIAESTAEALSTVDAMFNGRFGNAGQEVVIEEFLVGEEASFIVMTDGKHVIPFATSQDHKRRDDGDRGPNTGGMGAYSPAPVVTPSVHARIMQEVIEPTIRGLAADGIPYVGFLYAGLMIAPDGAPYVIEFNCRFGDPEAQPIMMRLQSDLTVLCEAAIDGRLHEVRADWDTRAALGVVLAAPGYPESVRTGDVIEGLEGAAQLPGKVFHAGTQTVPGGQVVTSGGRVLCAVGLGDSVLEAQRQAYALAGCIQWPGMQYRRDIGYRAIARERS